MKNSVVIINYWREIKDDISRNIDDIKKTALLTHNSAEFWTLIDFLNRLPAERIAYISLTKSFDSMKPFIGKLRPDFFVVDCISSYLFEKPSGDGCIYAKMPADISELKGLIYSVARQMKPSFIIVDSLSQFLDFTSFHSDQSEFVAFSEELSLLYQQNRGFSKIVFLYDEMHARNLHNLPKMDIKVIIRMEAFEETL